MNRDVLRANLEGAWPADRTSVGPVLHAVCKRAVGHLYRRRGRAAIIVAAIKPRVAALRDREVVETR